MLNLTDELLWHDMTTLISLTELTYDFLIDLEERKELVKLCMYSYLVQAVLLSKNSQLIIGGGVLIESVFLIIANNNNWITGNIISSRLHI
jgi:hypothetical protein